MSAGADPYEVLGVPRTATAQEIDRAYAEFVSRLERRADPAEFRRINEAYAALADAARTPGPHSPDEHDPAREGAAHDDPATDFDRECAAVFADHALAAWLRSWVRRRVEQTQDARADTEVTRAIRDDRLRVDAEWAALGAAYPLVAARLRPTWQAFRDAAFPRTSLAGCGRYEFLVIALLLLGSLIRLHPLFGFAFEEKRPEVTPEPLNHPFYSASPEELEEAHRGSWMLLAETIPDLRRSVVRRFVEAGTATPPEESLSESDRIVLTDLPEDLLLGDVSALGLPDEEARLAMSRLIEFRRAAAAAPK